VPWGTITATGWASGLNLWGTALLLGLAGRLDWADTPEELQQTWVLAVLGALYAVEFVIDKIPWLDSAWDVVNTAIRPLGGALLAAALAQDAGSTESVAALLGGTFALTAHGAKASTRAAINTSPEPFSNILASLTEDGIVAAMVALALAYPVAAGIVAVTFALASVIVTWMLFKAVRTLLARWRARRAGSVPA
jgi:Domain of unknown function (DUF4126)